MRRFITIVTIGFFIGVILIPLNPVHIRPLQLAFLGCAAGVWSGTLYLLWKQKLVRIALLILACLMAVPFILPGGEINVTELRNDYVRRMIEFEGTTYHWGGESSNGIDCSGLPRKALREALFWYGARHANGRACRMYLEQWWFDSSAKALGSGYRDYAVAIGINGRICKMDYTDLIPGDLAVTTNGAHVLAYIGDGKWIQADPGIGQVTTLDGHTDENLWFDMPVTTHRWSVLNDSENRPVIRTSN
ncbi:hypothetical protein BVY04_03120 [bacterium M21]|nr:hypothetical protein BVY04_03120 [bacterium M21]